MSGIQLEQGPCPPGHLTLKILASSAKLAVIEALPGPDEPGLPESALLPVAADGSGAEIFRELTEMEALGLIQNSDQGLRRSPAIADLILVRTSLLEWAGTAPRSQSEAADVPATPSLAHLVHRIWATDLLIHLAVVPSSPSGLIDLVPGYSLSSIKRYLQAARKAGLLGKGLNGNMRSQYSLARFGLLLIRPLCCSLRLEQRYFSTFSLPPSPELLNAGMAVIAQLLTLKPGEDREILFEVIDEDGNLTVIQRAVYRDGTLRTLGPAFHSSDPLCIRGTPSAWYDLIVDGERGGMQAINRGAKTILRQIPREFRHKIGSS